MYESISKNNELKNEMTLEMSYFWYSDDLKWTLSWILWHYCRLLIWIAEKNPGSFPEIKWLVMAAAVQPLLELVNILLVILQSPNLILSQQQKNKIKNLAVHLMLSMDIEMMDSNTEFENMLPVQYVTLEPVGSKLTMWSTIFTAKVYGLVFCSKV